MKRLMIVAFLILFALKIQAQEKTTTYSGKIQGYRPTLGFKTGQLYVNNVARGMGLTDLYLIDIAPDGKFSITFPLDANKECWISFPFFNSQVYFESGKKVIQDFDLSDVNNASSLFSGDGAIANNDINKVRSVFSYDWDTIFSNIYQLSPEQYTLYFLKMQNRKLAFIDSVSKAVGLSKTARTLATRDIKYSIAGLLIYYNENMETSYRRMNKIAFVDRKPVVKPVKLGADYFSFLRKLSYNDPSAMACYEYNAFLNKLKFLSLIDDKAGRLDYSKEIAALKQLDTADSKIKASIKSYEDSMLGNATAPGTADLARPIVLNGILKTNITMELELMILQDTCQNIDRGKNPLSDTQLANLKASLKHPYLFPSVLALNNKVKKEIENSKKQTGYNSNTTPRVAADSLLDDIISKYRGKVVFIDFWATWCSPCIMGIQEIAALKDELQNEDVVFLYITDNSSPLNTYNIMVPAIKGEHYRVSNDEYNVISKRLGIIGIPHYALANKKGLVVDKNFSFGNNEQLKAKIVSMTKD